jgi:hypothetical protein
VVPCCISCRACLVFFPAVRKRARGLAVLLVCVHHGAPGLWRFLCRGRRISRLFMSCGVMWCGVVHRAWEKVHPVAEVHRDNPQHPAFTILRKEPSIRCVGGPLPPSSPSPSTFLSPFAPLSSASPPPLRLPCAPRCAAHLGSDVWLLLHGTMLALPPAAVVCDRVLDCAGAVVAEACSVSLALTDDVVRRAKGRWVGNPGEDWGPKVRPYVCVCVCVCVCFAYVPCVCECVCAGVRRFLLRRANSCRSPLVLSCGVAPGTT